MGCAPRRLGVPVAALLAAANLGAGPELNPAAAVAAAAGHPSGQHLRAESTRVRAGETEIATLETAGLRRLERACVADLCGGTWFDGADRFAFGINGTPLAGPRAANPAERTFAAIASTAFGEPGFAAGGGSVGALPDARDGLQRYRVIAPRGAELIAVADAETHRLTRVENPDRTLYRPLVASVFGTTIVYGTRAYQRIVVPDAPLAAPAGPIAAVTDGPDLKLLSGRLPIVPCALGGRQLSCLIDTGTTPSAVTLDLAERLGREPHGQIEIAGLSTYLTGVIDAGPLAVGGAGFESLRFAVIPHAPDADFDVILGSDALARLRVTIDMNRQRARIAPSREQPTGVPMELDFSDGLPYLQVRLGPSAPPEAMLVDTADTGTLSIGYDRYRENPELFALRGAATASGLGGAPMDALQAEIAHAQIGGATLDGVQVSAVRGQRVGHVGFGFASWCRQFVLDFGQRRIECRTPSAAAGAATGQH